MSEIDRVIAMNPLKINDVFEVPAYQDVNTADRCYRYVLSIHKAT